MNQNFRILTCLLISTILISACGNETMIKDEYEVLIGSYSGELFTSKFSSSVSTVNLSVVEFAESEVTFYISYLGTTDILQIDRVGLEANVSSVFFDKTDDSGIRVEGRFERDGSNCDISIFNGNTTSSGELLKE